MNGLQVEEHALDGNTSLSGDIAKHLVERLACGPAVVVSKQPIALLSSVRKQWMVVLRRLEKERSSTANAAKVADLTNKITDMQQASFAAQSPKEALNVRVLFASAEQLLEFAPSCATMYVATPTDKETLHKITSFMPEDGMIIIKGKAAS